jgi:repressor LexA
MLTRKQLDLLNYINKHLSKDGVPPSFDEMKEALDLRSKSGIHRLITALEERGFIRRLAHRARAIEIVKLPESLETNNNVTELNANFSKNSSIKLESDTQYRPSSVHAKELPVMGRIAAGVPIEAISQVSHNVAIPGHMLRNGGDHYALEVKGDSMIEEGINDGDIVVIKETKTAVNGDIVVALVKDSEATLKRFFYRGDAIALEAANPAYETRIVPSDQVKVQGRLVGLIRSY